jgi:hypothetical protein
MGMTPEGKVKKRVKAILDEQQVYHFSPMQNGMGRAGIPDISGLSWRQVYWDRVQGRGQQTNSLARARTQPHTKRRR